MTTTFGARLKRYRLQTRQKQVNKPLTQEQLAELADPEDELGITLTMVNRLENNKRGVPRDQRDILLHLIRVLVEYEGISSLHEANELLRIGNYANLAEEEFEVVGLAAEPKTETLAGTTTISVFL